MGIKELQNLICSVQGNLAPAPIKGTNFYLSCPKGLPGRCTIPLKVTFADGKNSWIEDLVPRLGTGWETWGPGVGFHHPQGWLLWLLELKNQNTLQSFNLHFKPDIFHWDIVSFASWLSSLALKDSWKTPFPDEFGLLKIQVWLKNISVFIILESFSLNSFIL